MESTTNYFNSIDLFGLLNRWKKHLIIVGMISFVAAIFFSSPMFIKPKFKSEAIVYPSNLMAYSGESATEQMLQVAQSSDIRESMIKAFDLFSHYDIDTVKDLFHETHVIGIYEENVTIKKTEYESMQVIVYDTDPKVASRMVDSLIHFFNIKARQMQAEKSAEVMIIIGNQLKDKKQEMDSMENLIQGMSEQYGLLDLKSQTKEVTRAYFKNPSNKEVRDLYSALHTNGLSFNAINEHLWRTRGTYNDLKLAYENVERDVIKKLTYTNIVTKPFPSDKKATPVRWLIVAVGVGSSLLLAFMILIIMDTKKKKLSA